MELTVERDALVAALAPLTRVVPTKAWAPTLTHVLLRTTPGVLTLSGMDLELLCMTRTVAASVTVSDSATVPAATLAGFLSALPSGGMVRIAREVHGTSQRLRLTCGRSTATLATGEATDFPSVPQTELTPLWTMRADELRGAISDVGYAAARDTSRPVLHAVAIQGRGEWIEWVAADGFRAAIRRQVRPIGAPSDIALLVPSEALGHVARVLPASDEPVTFALGGTQLRIEMPGTTIQTRLIEGSYPNVHAVLTQEAVTRLECDREALIRAIRTALLFDAESQRITLTWEPEAQVIVVASLGSEIGEGRAEVPASSSTGHAQRLGANGSYLIQALSHLPVADVRLEIASTTAPLRIMAADDEDGDALAVVMPMVVAEAAVAA